MMGSCYTKSDHIVLLSRAATDVKLLNLGSLILPPLQ